MAELNVFECDLEEEDFKLWFSDRHEIDSTKENENIYAKVDDGKVIAIPKNSEGKEFLQEEFNEFHTNKEHYPVLFSNITKYGLIKTLLESNEFQALQSNMNDLKTNSIDRIYLKDKIFSPAEGLSLYPGLIVRPRFWNFPQEESLVFGMIMRYSTKLHFDIPLTTVLENSNFEDFWVKLKPSPELEETSLPDDTRLIGKFQSLTDTCEDQEFEEYDTFVELEEDVRDIGVNPPADLVIMDTNYSNVQKWAIDKFGQEKQNIIKDIRRKSLKRPKFAPEKKKSKFEHEQLIDTIEAVPKNIELPNGQKVTISTEPMEIVK
jgi:hypothetical protein